MTGPLVPASSSCKCNIARLAAPGLVLLTSNHLSGKSAATGGWTKTDFHSPTHRKESLHVRPNSSVLSQSVFPARLVLPAAAAAGESVGEGEAAEEGDAAMETEEARGEDQHGEEGAVGTEGKKQEGQAPAPMEQDEPTKGIATN